MNLFNFQDGNLSMLITDLSKEDVDRLKIILSTAIIEYEDKVNNADKLADKIMSAEYTKRLKLVVKLRDSILARRWMNKKDTLAISKYLKVMTGVAALEVLKETEPLDPENELSEEDMKELTHQQVFTKPISKTNKIWENHHDNPQI